MINVDSYQDFIKVLEYHNIKLVAIALLHCFEAYVFATEDDAVKAAALFEDSDNVYWYSQEGYQKASEEYRETTGYESEIHYL